MRNTLTLAVILLALLPGRSRAQANLVINGGFENPPVNGANTVISPGNALFGWTASASLDLVRSLWEPAEGAQSISLNQVGPSTISQALTTTAEAPYQLSFFMAAEVFGGSPNRTLDVLWNGNVIATPSFAYTGQGPDSMGWTRFTYVVVGTGNDILAFRSTTPSNYGPALDNVVVAPPQYQLAIEMIDDSNALITWSSSALGYVLDYAGAVPAAATWLPVLNPVVIVDDKASVTVETTDGPRFFRLRKP